MKKTKMRENTLCCNAWLCICPHGKRNRSESTMVRVCARARANIGWSIYFTYLWSSFKASTNSTIFRSYCGMWMCEYNAKTRTIGLNTSMDDDDERKTKICLVLIKSRFDKKKEKKETTRERERESARHRGGREKGNRFLHANRF